jgi:hypothetical protein
MIEDHDHPQYALLNHDCDCDHWLLWLLIIIALVSQ